MQNVAYRTGYEIEMDIKLFSVQTLGTIEFSGSTSMAEVGSSGRKASASMRKLGQSSDVCVPRINLCAARSPESDEGGVGSHWTVSDGHSREWHTTRSYSNGVFFFHTEHSSSTIASSAILVSLSLHTHRIIRFGLVNFLLRLTNSNRRLLISDWI